MEILMASKRPERRGPEEPEASWTLGGLISKASFCDGFETSSEADGLFLSFRWGSWASFEQARVPLTPEMLHKFCSGSEEHSRWPIGDGGGGGSSIGVDPCSWPSSNSS